MTYVVILHLFLILSLRASSKPRALILVAYKKKSSINLSAIKFDTLFLDPMVDLSLVLDGFLRNESDNIVRNKARLVAQGYTQIEGTDFEKIFAPVAQFEAIRMTLTFTSYKDFKLFQMDVKSAF